MSDHHSSHRRQQLRERSAGLFIFLFLISFTIFSGVILAYYFVPSPDLLFSSSPDRQRPGNRLVQISMSGSEFYVPTSILKRVKRRVLSSAEQIDVQIPWPYDHLAVISGTLRDSVDFRDWVLITLSPRSNRIPPDDRYSTVDRYYFAGPPAKDGDGMLRYDFKLESPYRDLQLFVDTRPLKPAAIRCDLKASSLGPILCERELAATKDVTARIRFARRHIEDWQEIEKISTNVIRALLRQTAVN
jgi:hypothetical protein